MLFAYSYSYAADVIHSFLHVLLAYFLGFRLLIPPPQPTNRPLSLLLPPSKHSSSSLAQHNLVMLFAYLYGCGLVRADVMYSFLHALRARFAESDVSALVTALNASGLQLRSDDPAAMKEFVLGVHARAAEMGKEGGHPGGG